MKTVLPEADHIGYRDGNLFVEGVPLEDLASRFGTPLYVYSLSHIRAQYRRLREILAPLQPAIHYAVKANACGALLRTLAELGSGADVVSGGELWRARRAGIPAERIVFAGVGKTVEEIDYGLQENIRMFTVESEAELERISGRARQIGKIARIAIRVNPDVDPQTHVYTTTGKKETKFGLDLERAREAYIRVGDLPGVRVYGIHMHLGSPLADEQPYVEALRRVDPLCRWLKERYETFQILDLGGGFGIPYRRRQKPFDLSAWLAQVGPLVQNLGMALALEPGRYIVGNAGVLVTRVQYVKENPVRRFVVVDAGMNDLIRPPLYHAWHEIVALRDGDAHFKADVVGPICESGDFFAQDREVPVVREGDLLAVMSAGAYGFAMSSNYNSRGRPSEVVVDGDRAWLARRRETWEDLIALEV